jgi:hypothetical protein
MNLNDKKELKLKFPKLYSLVSPHYFNLKKAHAIP